MYSSGTVRGAILSRGVAEDPNAPGVRTWRVRPDWQTADLTQDAAVFFGVPLESITQEQIDAVRTQYEKDWNEWPWEKGAPFYDTNENGVMDEGEEPGLLDADQVVWLVANDLSVGRTNSLFGSPPIGIEMQVTFWAYNRTGSQLDEALQHIIFKRVRLIYKGRSGTQDTARIDRMFIAQWADTDIGFNGDDFVGCDTLLQLGYGYNSSINDSMFQQFNFSTPAFGYSLIQGPLVPSHDPLDIGYLGKRNFTNMPMTSFWYGVYEVLYNLHDPYGVDYERTVELYSCLNGLAPRSGTAILDPDGNPTKFPLSGDPVTETGWIDGIVLEPGDRLFQINSGPFSMALGDTQEVIVAMVGGLGSSHLASVSVMKHFVKWARYFAGGTFLTGMNNESSTKRKSPKTYALSQNYPNPFNPVTTIRYVLPKPGRVSLRVYDLLGREVSTLVDGRQGVGEHVVVWDAGGLGSGVYFYRLQVEGFTEVRKCVLLE